MQSVSSLKTPLLDQQHQSHVEESHYIDLDGCSRLSKFLFSWCKPFIVNSSKRLLELRDLPALPSSLDTQSAARRFESQLEKQDALLKNASCFHLYSCLFFAHGRFHYLSLGIVKFLLDCLGIANPFLLKRFLDWLQSSNGMVLEGSLYASLLAGITLISAFMSPHYNYQIACIALNVRSSMMTAVFQRCTLHPSQGLIKDVTENLSATNLINIDSQRVADTVSSFNELWSLPVQVALSFYLLYCEVGWSFIAGVLFMMLVVPINMFLARAIQQSTIKLSKHRDCRIEKVRSALKGIRTIKSYSLENYVVNEINSTRSLELFQLKRRKLADAGCVFFWAVTPVVVVLATVATYYWMNPDSELTTGQLFSSITLLNMLVYPFNAFPWVINGIMEARVSAKRLQKFFAHHNLHERNSLIVNDSAIDAVSDSHSESNTLQASNLNTAKVYLSDLWIAACSKNAPVTDSTFRFGPINLALQSPCILAVTGPISSGKSVFLRALANECAIVSGSLQLRTNVSFCTQEPFLFDGTIMDNILFGSPLNENIFKNVVTSCGLDRDLTSWIERWSHLVGPGGRRCSSGQRMRISLARAMYRSQVSANSRVLILDSPTTGLDEELVHMVLNALIKFASQVEKHSELVTIVALKPMYPPQILAGSQIRNQQTSNHVSHIHSCKTNSVENEQRFENQEPAEDEHREFGGIAFFVLKEYTNAVGGYLAFASIFFILLMQASRNLFDFFLAHWTSSLESIPLHSRLMDIAYLSALNLVIAIGRSFLFAYAGLSAASCLHLRLISKIFCSSLLFFDSKSIGIIMNRISSDIDAVDESLPFQLNILLAQTCLLLGCVCVISISCPALAIIFPFLAILYFKQQFQYRHGSRALKRLESSCRSPVYTLVSDICDGAPVIRAMNASKFFDDRFGLSLHSYFGVLHAIQGGTQWFGLRLQLIGAVIVTLICVFAMIEKIYTLPIIPIRSPEALAAFIGLSLSQAVPLNSYLNGFVMALAETEKQFVGVERILQMILDCEQSADQDESSDSRVFLTDSDQFCAVEVQNVSMEHHSSGTLGNSVLQNVSFSLARGTYTAIVGRSGSGKSTLIHMIARFHACKNGCVKLFGQDIRSIPKSILRGDIVIVLVQEPFIFPASIRFNVDPLKRLSDDQILFELREIGALSALLDCAARDNYNEADLLNWNPSNLSSELSYGLQQLVCVARAICSKASIILADEAAAHVDDETEKKISMAFARAAKQGRTILSIAHRPESMNLCDRVRYIKPEHCCNVKNYLINNMFAGTAYHRNFKTTVVAPSELNSTEID